MAFGPGKYDDLCTYAREAAKAQGVVLIVTDGERGSGFSVQGPLEVHMALPELLEQAALQIRASWQQENPGLMLDTRTVAFAVLTIGKAAGMLSKEDIRRDLIDAMQRGTLNPHYLALLRDQLAELLNEAAKGKPDAE